MGPKLSPLIISKVKTPAQPVDKSPTTLINNEFNWHIVESNNRNRSPPSNSPLSKKSNNIFFTSKNRYAPLTNEYKSENENKN